MNRDELLRYILMKREKEMGNELSEEQKVLYNKIESIYNSDSRVKEQIDMLLNTNSIRDTYSVLNGERVNTSVESTLQEDVIEDIPDEEITGGDVVEPQIENGRQYTLNNKKAGFADALIMALVTGFVGGVATTVLFMLI